MFGQSVPAGHGSSPSDREGKTKLRPKESTWMVEKQRPPRCRSSVEVLNPECSGGNHKLRLWKPAASRRRKGGTHAAEHPASVNNIVGSTQKARVAHLRGQQRS